MNLYTLLYHNKLTPYQATLLTRSQQDTIESSRRIHNRIYTIPSLSTTVLDSQAIQNWVRAITNPPSDTIPGILDVCAVPGSINQLIAQIRSWASTTRSSARALYTYDQLSVSHLVELIGDIRSIQTKRDRQLICDRLIQLLRIHEKEIEDREPTL